MTEIKKVAVIGAGVMGGAIAAHLGNAGVPTVLMDILPKAAKNRKTADETQFNLFVDPAVEVMKAIDQTNPDQLTPIAALALIQDWKKRLGR